ncbi:cytochrome c oxidase subunit II [Alphaproteobacteria bacterium]|nr:cytochrome c oxidase subunit II [Alphaproteobacteria bacterium]
MKSILSVFFIFISFELYGKQATDWQLSFQNPATDLMGSVVGLHNIILIVMTLVTLFVLFLLFYVSFRFSAKRNPIPSTTTHNTVVEVLWTAIPIVILVVLAIPSFKLLYQQEKSENYDMTVKVIGHQWYWEYEYPDHGDFYFESYMVQEQDLEEGDLRLLTVDNPLVIPANKNIQILITAGDVLHSWAVPSMGLKTDAVPGRLNETWVNVKEPGIYRGQCSEICGSGHGFMPVVVKVLPEREFMAWANEAKNNYAINDDIEINKSEEEIVISQNNIIQLEENNL